MPEEFDDVCVSYSRKNGSDVKRVVAALRRARLSVYFDLHREAEAAGRNLISEILRVYPNAKRCCLAFSSKAYAKGKYTRLELITARERALDQRGYLLMVRLDNTELPDMLPGTVWIRGQNRVPERIAEVIIKKITGKDPPPRTTVQRVQDYARYRRWWGAAVLAFTIALVGVAAYLQRPSHTSVQFDHATQHTIVVRVKNSGGQPSRLAGYRLKFKDVPLENAELRMVRTERSLIEPGEVLRNLRPHALELIPTSEFVDEDELQHRLANGVVTLEVDVAESNAAKPRTESRTIDNIDAFIKRWVPDVP